MFFRFSAHTKSTIDFFVPRLSNVILSDWLRLTLGEFNNGYFCYSFSTSLLQHCKQNQIFLVESSLFLPFVPIFVFLEVYFKIDKLSTELKQTVPYYVNRLMTKGVIIDINCNLQLNFFCAEEFFFVLVLKFIFDILLRLLSEDLEALFLIGLLKPRSETEWSLLDNWEWILFEVLGKVFWKIGRIETYGILIVQKFCFYSSWWIKF